MRKISKNTFKGLVNGNKLNLLGATFLAKEVDWTKVVETAAEGLKSFKFVQECFNPVEVHATYMKRRQESGSWSYYHFQPGTQYFDVPAECPYKVFAVWQAEGRSLTLYALQEVH